MGPPCCLRVSGFPLLLTSEFQVKVTLLLTVSQSVWRSVESTLGLVTRYYFLSEGCCLKIAVLSLWGALSDDRSGLLDAWTWYLLIYHGEWSHPNAFLRKSLTSICVLKLVVCILINLSVCIFFTRTIARIRLGLAEAEAEVTLRLTVSQSVSTVLSSPLWDLRPDISSVWNLLSCFCGTPSLTRCWVCLMSVTASINWHLMSKAFNYQIML
jgi:hypothetical protein